MEKNADDSYISTEWITIFYLPIFPLRSFRVIKQNSNYSQAGYSMTSQVSYKVIDKIPFNIFQVLFTYFAILIPVFFAVVLLIVITKKPKSGDNFMGILSLIALASSPIYMILYSLRTRRNPVGWAIFGYFFPLLPFIFAFFVPSLKKKKAAD